MSRPRKPGAPPRRDTRSTPSAERRACPRSSATTGTFRTSSTASPGRSGGPGRGRQARSVLRRDLPGARRDRAGSRQQGRDRADAGDAAPVSRSPARRRRRDLDRLRGRLLPVVAPADLGHAAHRGRQLRQGDRPHGQDPDHRRLLGQGPGGHRRMAGAGPVGLRPLPRTGAAGRSRWTWRRTTSARRDTSPTSCPSSTGPACSGRRFRKAARANSMPTAIAGSGATRSWKRSSGCISTAPPSRGPATRATTAIPTSTASISATSPLSRRGVQPGQRHDQPRARTGGAGGAALVGARHPYRLRQLRAPSGAPIYIMGLSHAQIVDGRVRQEWVTIDEVVIWKQIIAHQRGAAPPV